MSRRAEDWDEDVLPSDPLYEAWRRELSDEWWERERIRQARVMAEREKEQNT